MFTEQDHSSRFAADPIEAQSYASADYAEGLAAVRAKRPPAF